MHLNIINSKPFFGTESLQESQELCDLLQQSSIRCQCDELSGVEATRHYSSDPFHLYAKNYLEKLLHFYIIRVHRFDYQKAIQIYNSIF